MSTLKAMIIDPDAGRGRALGLVLEYLEYQAVCVADPRQWQAHLEEAGGVDMVFLGPCTADSELVGVFREIRAHDQHLPVIATADSMPGAVLSAEVEGGAIARVALPVRHQDLQQALQQVAVYRETRHLGGSPRSLELFRSLVGTSAGIRRVRQLIEQVADTDANVLLLGESGTGKEVVARNIHYHSARRYKPFVPVNCGAIPPELLESELFGHEKGAFTGAVNARRGRFEMAIGGTLFLDEIGDMPLPMQVKLLRVLQEKTFERVGSNRSLTTDARIIAATHSNLEEAIEDGRFREDLYYRLNVFPIEVPALRDRAEDLPMLVNDLVSRLEHEKRASIQLTPAALECLRRYSWPGNVRELANLVERLAILFPYGVVDTRDLPEKYRVEAGEQVDTGADTEPLEPAVSGQSLPREGIDLREHLTRLEYTLIKQALEESDGVVAHAARRLKLGRTTLVEKMRKHGLRYGDDTQSG